MRWSDRSEAVAALRRLRLKAVHAITAPFAPIGRRVMWWTHIPSLPRFVRFRHNPPLGPWSPFGGRVPTSLRGVIGIRRVTDQELAAYESKPLRYWNDEYPTANAWFERDLWRTLLTTYPRLMRIIAGLNRQPELVPPERREAGAGAPDARAGDFTGEVKAYAATVGLSAVGVAPYDPKYTVTGDRPDHSGSKLVADGLEDLRVVVCIIEQNYDATQSLPSARAEKAAITAYSDGVELSEQVAAFLRKRGYQARAYDPEGPGIVIHYGVQAGLGQLGLNGQLLTPQAGSRCRINLILTDAPLTLDEPKDFGINRLCDACGVCVRRCPGHALTRVRKVHRGVEKAKLRTERCLPVMVVANACAICMKVCPVQRFGLEAVLEHYDATGTVLGKGTDDLEGFTWPLDGRRYGPGNRPAMPEGLFERSELDEFGPHESKAG